MARTILGIGVALASLAAATPASAQSVDSDIRCLLAANVFAQQEKDPAKKRLAANTYIFYLGRLDARISNEQLKAAILPQAKAMPAASLGPTMTACANHLLTHNALAIGPPAPPSAAQKRK